MMRLQTWRMPSGLFRLKSSGTMGSSAGIEELMSAGSAVADAEVTEPAEDKAATDSMPEIPALTHHDYCDGSAGFKADPTALSPDSLIPSERAYFRVEISPGRDVHRIAQQLGTA